MTLDEAIEYCERIADYDCYNDRQIAEYLLELKKLKEKKRKRKRRV